MVSRTIVGWRGPEGIYGDGRRGVEETVSSSGRLRHYFQGGLILSDPFYYITVVQ
jgi:hypothetical protein